ncbi:MAG TPA: hypothetical protein VLN26_18435 [Gaiellaceae bacterium]|nr:hypothetical protein [Gaiellaceae bacterium]
MGHGYTELRIRQNRELLAQHPRWRHVRPERLRFPKKQSPFERYETAVIDAQRRLRQAEELFEHFEPEEH